MPWHVAHLITRLDLGGAQLATLYEAAHGDFADDGRSLIFGPGGMLEAEARALPRVECRPVSSLRREVSPLADLRALWALRGELRRLKSAVAGRKLLVHTHTSKAGILGRWAAKLAGADLIVHTAHGFGHSHHGSGASRRLFKLAEQLTGRITDGFTADSAANVHQGRAEGLFAGRPARVVRCGIDVAAHAMAGDPASLRQTLEIPEGDAVVLNLSCLKPQKDPLTFARVAARVLDRAPATTFLLAGDGELRPRLEREVARLGIGQRFRILGWRRDVPALLGASDLLVMTSRWEGLPQVFAQAMAAGLPIVATRVDGAPEAIEVGENGLLCDVGDVSGLTAAVVGLLRDPKARRRMGARGRDRAHEFSQERMVRTLDRYYAGLAAERAERGNDGREEGG